MGDDENERGFDALFADSFRTVVRTVWFIVGDWEEAREVAQDSFAAAFVHWRKVSAYENPGAWVRRVAIRKAVRAQKRSRRPATVGAAAVADLGTTDGELDVRDAILRLPVDSGCLKSGASEQRVVSGATDDRLGRGSGTASALLQTPRRIK